MQHWPHGDTEILSKEGTPIFTFLPQAIPNCADKSADAHRVVGDWPKRRAQGYRETFTEAEEATPTMEEKGGEPQRGLSITKNTLPDRTRRYT